MAGAGRPILAEAELVDLFAAQAALVMGYSRTVSQVEDAPRSRNVIGQAIGWVMARYRLVSDAAFVYLVRQSQAENTKLRDVCAQIMATAECEAESTDRAARP